MSVCVVGPGTRFISGITYYTYGLVEALDEVADVSVIFLRRLLPQRLYPGKDRVGADISRLRLPSRVPAYDGIDWFWLPSLLRAIVLLVRRRPDTLVLQWWTGTVLHTYLALVLVAKVLRMRVVIELHEALDTGEDKIPFVRHYVRLLAPLLFRSADAYTVHSEFDRKLVMERFGLDADRIAIVPLARFDQYEHAGGTPTREAPEGVVNLLYFGIIRPFKGVEDLVRAFEQLDPDEVQHYWLTVVGETWEGTTAPAELIARSPLRDRITFINRYVTDEEADGLFAGADVVVLPYHRSSQSGPLHMAFAYGKPVVVTAVGGLVEACEGYDGAVLVEPADPASLVDGIRRSRELQGQTYEHHATFPAAAQKYRALLERLHTSPRPATPDGEGVSSTVD